MLLITLLTTTSEPPSFAGLCGLSRSGFRGFRVQVLGLQGFDSHTRSRRHGRLRPSLL